MKKTKCPRCGKTAFEPATYAARRDLDGRRFTGDVPARKCTSCGELLISGPGLGAFERAITLELARGGEVGPEGFRWLRKAAGLKAVRLAELLEVTPMQGVALGEQPQAARTASGRLGLRPGARASRGQGRHSSGARGPCGAEKGSQDRTTGRKRCQLSIHSMSSCGTDSRA